MADLSFWCVFIIYQPASFGGCRLVDVFLTRRTCLLFCFYLGFLNGSKSNIRISALLLHYVQLAQSTFVLVVDKCANADAKSLSSCTTLLSLLIIITAGISLGPSAFAALCKVIALILAVCVLPSFFFATCASKILYSAICALSLSKDFKFVIGGSRDLSNRSAQSGDVLAQQALVNSLESHAAYSSSLNVGGTLPGGALANSSFDINEEGDVSFIWGRGTGLVLKRTGRDREDSRIYGKWVSPKFKDFAGWVSLRWLVLVNADCKRLFIGLKSQSAEVWFICPVGMLVCTDVYGAVDSLTRSTEMLPGALFGRCPRSLFSFYTVVFCSSRSNGGIPSDEGGCGNTCLKMPCLVALRASDKLCGRRVFVLDSYVCFNSYPC